MGHRFSNTTTLQGVVQADARIFDAIDTTNVHSESVEWHPLHGAAPLLNVTNVHARALVYIHSMFKNAWTFSRPKLGANHAAIPPGNTQQLQDNLCTTTWCAPRGKHSPYNLLVVIARARV